MECDDGSEISSRVYGGREDGVMGSLAARGVSSKRLGGLLVSRHHRFIISCHRMVGFARLPGVARVWH